MLNTCIVAGRMTANPEIRHTQSGVAVATFRLAVDRDFKDKNTGERGVDFIPVVCWRNMAEFVTKFFGKGQLAMVVGRLQVRDYTDSNNEKRYVTEIVAKNVYFGDSKKKEQTEGQADPFYPVDDDEEIPF